MHQRTTTTPGRPGGPHRPTNRELTTREREVAILAAGGLSNGEIGAKLHLTDDTIKTHMRRAFFKTKSRNRVELVGWAYRNGLLDGPRELPPPPPLRDRKPTIDRMYDHLNTVSDQHREKHRNTRGGCEKCRALDVLRKYILEPW